MQFKARLKRRFQYIQYCYYSLTSNEFRDDPVDVCLESLLGNLVLIIIALILLKISYCGCPALSEFLKEF